ncbi:MAG: DoxX family protein [Gemmataceae bacterium]
MSLLQNVLSVFGRVCLCVIFLMSAVGKKIPDFNGTVEYMEGEMPFSVDVLRILLVGAIAFLILGSVSIIAGYWARIGAFLLLVFLGLATYFFHDFWTFDPESKEFQMQMLNFMKNLGLFGGLLFIMANGSGAGSLDSKSSGNASYNKDDDN